LSQQGAETENTRKRIQINGIEFDPALRKKKKIKKAIREKMWILDGRKKRKTFGLVLGSTHTQTRKKKVNKRPKRRDITRSQSQYA